MAFSPDSALELGLRYDVVKPLRESYNKGKSVDVGSLSVDETAYVVLGETPDVEAVTLSFSIRPLLQKIYSVLL